MSGEIWLQAGALLEISEIRVLSNILLVMIHVFCFAHHSSSLLKRATHRRVGAKRTLIKSAAFANSGREKTGV